MGNYKDEMMEQLANKGNGNNYYIDGLSQAKRVFQEQLGGTLEVVAKDVKLQLDLDPALVKRYRLVGYENRDIADADFRDDKVDAGEIGAGHTVTAIYELELATALRADLIPADLAKLATLHIRAKAPNGTKAIETTHGFAAARSHASFDGAPADLRFAAAVMAAAEILRKSEHASGWSVDQVLAIARAAAPADSAERQEFVSLVERMKPLAKVAVRDR
jgi:Ca-activated chloride channel family protein